MARDRHAPVLVSTALTIVVSAWIMAALARPTGEPEPGERP